MLGDTNIDPANAEALVLAAINTWNSVLQKDLPPFVRNFRASFEVKVAIFPRMVNDEMLKTIEKLKDNDCG